MYIVCRRRRKRGRKGEAGGDRAGEKKGDKQGHFTMKNLLIPEENTVFPRFYTYNNRASASILNKFQRVEIIIDYIWPQ